MMVYRTEIVRSQDHFERLHGVWNDLLLRSRTNTIFSTWEWLYSWWDVFGKNGQLFVVTVRDESDALVGAAPLCLRKISYYGLPVRELTFIGTGHADRQDFLISGGAGPAQIIQAEIMNMLWSRRNEWDIIHLDQIPADVLASYSELSGESPQAHELSSSCPYIHIDGSWEAYDRSLSKKFHRDLKHKYNRLNRFGNWIFTSTTVEIGEIDKLIRDLFIMEEGSRKSDGGKTLLSDAANRDFIARFGKQSGDKRWLDCSSIRVDGKNIAYLIGFRYGAKYYAYNMAFIEDYYQASPGKILLNEKIKWCFENQAAVKEFDFLRGGTYVKSLWTETARQHSRIVFYNGTIYSALLRYAVFTIRPMLKALLAVRPKHRNNASVES